MKFFGFNITIGLLLVALVFYFVGAKYPKLANKVWP